MPLQSARDLFVYELSALHALEQSKLQLLPVREQQCRNPQVKRLFGKEIPETEQQIARVQECFRLMGVQPMNVTPHAINSLRQDVTQFAQREPSQEVTDLFSLETAMEIDHYEIAAYAALVQMAREMGEIKIASLLDDNLKEERSSAREMAAARQQVSESMVATMAP